MKNKPAHQQVPGDTIWFSAAGVQTVNLVRIHVYHQSLTEQVTCTVRGCTGEDAGWWVGPADLTSMQSKTGIIGIRTGLFYCSSRLWKRKRYWIYMQVWAKLKWSLTVYYKYQNLFYSPLFSFIRGTFKYFTSLHIQLYGRELILLYLISLM